jgi:hypothetical protein
MIIVLAKNLAQASHLRLKVATARSELVAGGECEEKKTRPLWGFHPIDELRQMTHLDDMSTNV